MKSIVLSLMCIFILSAPSGIYAQEKQTFTIVIKDHIFIPKELKVPAHQKIQLIVDNQDSTPEEFESFELNREKIISGNKKGIIFIGPLKPGIYKFFGEFHPATAQGAIVAQ